MTIRSLLLALALSAPAFAQSRQDVLHHLEQTIAWYRQVSAAEQTPAVAGDVLLRDSTVETAIEALELAFDYGHAEAALLGHGSEEDGAARAIIWTRRRRGPPAA